MNRIVRLTGRACARYPLTLAMLLAIVAMELVMAGCPKPVHVTNLPTNVSEKEVNQWYAAAGILDEIGTNTNNATDAAVKLHNIQFQGHALLEGPAYTATLTALGKISQGGIHARNTLHQAPQHWSNAASQSALSAFVDDAVAELEKANTEGLTGIKNSEHAKEINEYIGNIQTALQSLRLMLAIKS